MALLLHAAPLRRSIFTGVLTAICAGVPGCAPRAHLAPGAPAGADAIPLAFGGQYAAVPVRVATGAAAADSLWFVVDLAASSTAIAPGTRDRLRLGTGQSAAVTGAGGAAQYQAFALDTLALGGRTHTKVGVVVLDIPAFRPRTSAGAPQRVYAGLLGHDVLRAYDFAFDVPARRLELVPRRTDSRPALPALAGANGGQAPACVANLADAPGWIVVDVQVDGATVRGIVDTGAPTTVLNWPAATAAGVTRESPGLVANPAPTRGLGPGSAQTWRYQFGRVAVGAGVLRRDTVRIADLPVFRQLGLGDRPAMLLGLDLLRDRPLYVSYSTGQVCVARSPSARGGA